MAAAENASKGPLPQGSGPLRPQIEHGSCVCIAGRAVLIIGKSGSGKSGLALELLSRGAALIADDRTILSRQEAQVIVEAPKEIQGKIEARNVGLLNANYHGPAVLALVVDLDQVEENRLPDWHTITRLGVQFPLLYAVPSPHFSAAILQYLTHGRSD